MNAGPVRTLDLRGKECPFTILEIAEVLDTLKNGDSLKVISDRNSIVEDLKAWCEGTGTELVDACLEGLIEIHLRKR